MSLWNKHAIFEKNSIILVIGIIVAISIGGLVEIAPLFYLRSTIEQVKNRTHWNASNLAPMDPVSLGICSQIDLDMEVERSSKGRTPVETGDTLLPAATTEVLTASQVTREEDEQLDADKVFAKLSALRGRVDEDSDQ